MTADVRYIHYHAWWMGTGHTTTRELLYAYVAENLLETWMPPDRSQDWLLRRTLTGRRRWLVGDESQADRPGWPTGEWLAPYGDFYAADGHRTPSESPPGQWHRPNPAWLDDLPRDPGLLLDRLRTALPGRQSDVRLLHHAAQAGHSGQLPADLTVALYQGLASLPGVTTRESVANLDGRSGTALVAEDEFRAEELIIDVDAGAFLGERTTLTAAMDGIPAGTVTAFTSMSTAWADALGATP
jgi:hypothetical protein